MTERKYLPDVDVGAAGIWKNAVTLKTAYQRADPETILRVVLEAGETREAKSVCLPQHAHKRAHPLGLRDYLKSKDGSNRGYSGTTGP